MTKSEQCTRIDRVLSLRSSVCIPLLESVQGASQVPMVEQVLMMSTSNRPNVKVFNHRRWSIASTFSLFPVDIRSRLDDSWSPDRIPTELQFNGPKMKKLLEIISIKSDPSVKTLVFIKNNNRILPPLYLLIFLNFDLIICKNLTSLYFTTVINNNV